MDFSQNSICEKRTLNKIKYRSCLRFSDGATPPIFLEVKNMPYFFLEVKNMPYFFLEVKNKPFPFFKSEM